MVMLMELRQMLNKIGMNKDVNSATMFKQIASVENRYNTAMKKIQEEELIAIVLDKSTMDYKAPVLMAEQRVRETLLKLDYLKLVMTQHWHQISRVDESNNGGTKVSLSAINGAKIVCFKCGKEGHKASNCPKNGKGGGKGFTKGGARGQKDKRKCYQCNKVRAHHAELLGRRS
jgi:hypothetical protein